MDNQTEVVGKIYKIGEVETIKENFTKRSIIIYFFSENERSGKKYEDHIPIELVNNKTSLVDDLKVGDNVRVKCHLRGNIWEKGGTEKAILNLHASSIEKAEASA